MADGLVQESGAPVKSGAKGTELGRRSRAEAFGTIAVSVSNVVKYAVQLGILPVLARLIGPREYGLVALAVPFILFCNVLTDVGLSNALARKRDPSAEVESTVFWLTGGIGLALALLFCLLAWPIAMILGHPQLPLLIIALSPVVVMCGLTAVGNARIIRTGRFAVFAGGDVVSTVVSSSVALAAALHGLGAWSIVAQQLAFWACKLAWVHIGSRVRVKLVCKPREVLDLIRFGGHSLGSMLGDFATRNIDNIIVGGVLGALPLGYYAMAYQIIRVPDFVISGPLYLFVFSRIAHQAETNAAAEMIRTTLVAVRCASVALAPIFAGLAMLAPLAIPIVLGPEWRGLIVCLQWLSLAGFGFSMAFVFSAILMGAGRPELQLRASIVGSVLTIGGVAATVHLGVEAVAIAVALATLATASLSLQMVSTHLQVPKRALLAVFAPVVAAVGGMLLALEGGLMIMASLPVVLQLVLLIGLGAAAYGLIILATARRQLIGDLRFIMTGAIRTEAAE